MRRGWVGRMPADLLTAFLRAYFAFHRVDVVQRVLVQMQNDRMESKGQLLVGTPACLPPPPVIPFLNHQPQAVGDGEGAALCHTPFTWGRRHIAR